MKKIYFLLLTYLLAANVSAQSTANYVFATSASGSLVDMSAGTNQLVGSLIDDGQSAITNIGFDFWMMGTRYTQFSANSNGLIELGGNAVGIGTNVAIGSTASTPFISAFSFDQETGASGKVHYKVIGSAPNRTLVIEWLNMQIGYGATIGDDVYQVQLSETSGAISFIYGNMVYRYAPSATTVSIGFQSSNTNNTYATVNENTNVVTTSGAPTTYTLGTTVPINMQVHSTANGSRRTYSFTPAVPIAPTGLNFTGVAPGAMTLNWTDNAVNELGYVIYRSTDGINYNFVSQTPANATSSFQSALTPSTLYYWRVYALTEGGLSTPLAGSQSTAACGGIAAGTYTVGPTGSYPSLTAVATALIGGSAGPVIFELQPTYLSSVETFPITFSASTCSLPGGVIIRPQAGAVALSVTSANATGTINFDGGTNITFDGRAGGVGISQLTISNSSLTGYTIQLINSARFNTFKYCAITGINNVATSGVIVFNNAAGFPTGNSNNTIDNCDIHDASGTPTNLVYCSGNITDYASGNNNNTVSNCNIHDWFNASATTASAAINIVGGASDWTITANSFYQSVVRTFTMTTATDLGAISLFSTAFGNNFTISNNYFGGSTPLCGGIAWTWTGGATGTPTLRMINFNTAIGATSNITGNTFANLNITTSSASTRHGMIIHQNGNINISNNTIGSQTTTGNIVFTLASTSTSPFLLPIGTGTGATPSSINITNNNLGSIIVQTSSTGSVSFRIVYSSAVAGSQVNIAGNTVGGTIANSIQQNTNNIMVGIMSLANALNQTVTGNTIRNLTQNNAGVTGSITGINCQAATSGNYSITNNTIHTLTTNGANVNFGNAASIVGLTTNVVAGPGGNNISGNTVSNLINTNTTVAGVVVGICPLTPPPAAATAGNSIISKNIIHSFSTPSTTATQVGIFNFNTGGGLFYNNMVRLGIDATGASNTNSVSIYGIYKGASANANFSFNTVYIGGAGVVSGTVATYAYARTGSGTADTVMNNIFVNARSNASGTGGNVAEYLNSNTAIVSNYNDLFASGTGGVLGSLAGVGYTTLPLWRTATNQDWNSISANPNLLNPTGNSATFDLHINGAIGTPVEQAGYNLAQVTDDYDGQSRAGLTPVDIGADAGNFIISDVAPPVIYQTALINTCSTGDRTITGVNITDATGVPVAGALRPRIYYKKGAGSYFSQPGTLTSGTATNGTWSFTIVASDMSGVVAGDVISYYIIAQDNVATPNIASNPGGAVATNVNSITTQPITPLTYTINGTSLSGTYNVGAGGSYLTLTAAIAAYNNACLAGPVVFKLTNTTYSATETFPITINNNPFASSVNTLTIQPAPAVAATITGLSASAALIKMLNARYVTIDGLNSGGSTLTLTNTNTTTSTANIWLASTTTVGPGCNNITIQNTTINGGSNSFVTNFGIVACSDGASPSATSGPDNDNVTIQGNTILKTYYGIYGNGLTYLSAGGLDNWNISNNIIGPAAAGANNTGFAGIWLQNAVNATISGNTIQNLLASAASAGGIYLNSNIDGATVSLNTISSMTSSTTSSGTGSITGIFVGNRVINANINRNKITSIINTNIGGAGARAVILSTSSTANSNITLSNNMISDVYSYEDAANTLWPIGIDLEGSGSGIKLYYNSVNLYGAHPGFSTTAGGAASLFINSTGSNIDIRDNILSDSYDNSSSTGDKSYAIYSTAFSGLQYNTLNYNDYYVSGPAAILGNINATDRTTLAAVQAGFGGNANSINVAPVYVTNTNLHLQTGPGLNWCLNGSGIVIPAVTDDIDGDVRSLGVAPAGPDMGADEFVATGSGSGSPASQSVCSGAAITPIILSGGTTYTWTRDNVATAPGIAASGSGNISGTLTNTSGAPVTVTFTITPSDAGGCPGPAFTATVLVSPIPVATAAPSSQTTCSGVAITTIVLSSSTAGATYGWVRDNVATVTGIPANGSGNISGTLNNATGSAVTVTFTITPMVNGCMGTTITATVLVSAMPNAVATPSSQQSCSGLPITTIVLTGSAGGTVFNWTRDNPGITGIPASGAGDISGTLNNPTNAPVTVSFTITPTASGCTGTPVTATVTVNPTPNAVATPSSQIICSGDPITTIAITGSVAGTTFNWTRDNPAVTGIATSGAGDISGSLINNTGAPVTVTFTITPTANGCAGTPITATVTVNSRPTWTTTIVQPTTCVSTDGSITLNMTGPGGPYTFAWTGPGVNPSAQNQTNLTVGIYNVTVTVNATGCQSSATYTLNGPGSCFVCPTIPNLATNPSPTACLGSNVIIQASGLTNMGITFGITFKYSLGSALLNPYTGGTVIATVPNGSLTSGGTVATTNATFATAGTYYIYAILSPTPVDPSCRPSNVVVLTVNNNPTLTLGASPTVCSGSVSAPLPFTSTYTGPNGNTVVNGGFETGGSAPWVVLSAQPAPVISGTVSHSGTYSYALGSFGPGETPGDASVYQTISVPAEGGTLSYWYKPATADNINFDWQDAYITNTSGTILQTLMHVCSNSNVWTQVSVNMSAYAGQTVRIEFLVHGDNAGDPTNMYVDDVVLNGPGGGPATYSITWNAPAPAQGFTNVSNAALPSSPTPITLVIPAAAAPGTYTGTVTVTNSNGCSSTGQPFSVTINPIPVVNQPASQVVCNNTSTSAVNFTTPTTGPGTIVYNWSHSASGIGLANNGTGNIPVFTAINNTSAPVVATITVTPTYTYNGVTCFGQPKQFTITINPTPTVNAVASQTVCHNTATAAVNFTGFVAGTVYNWTNTNTTIGLAASGTGNIGSFTATNAGTTPAVATITVTPSYSNAGVTCTGAPVSFTITVNPRPVINAVGNQTVCNGSATTAVVFTSNTAAGNTTYGWTNSNTAIGLGASGTGNIGSFTATNTTGLPITGTITVTPTYTNNGTSCTGAPVTFTITVNPSPTVNPLPANQILCNGSATTPVAFNGPVSGAFYTWTNNQPSIGLGSVGSSNIPSFIATNAGTAPVVATVTVTGNYTNGGVTCTGPSVSFTYTVNPTPSVNALANQTLCNGTASAAVTLGGPVPGTVFTWTNNNTTIGLGSGGTGNIPGFVATNTTNVPVTATVTVTPVYTANGISCSGTPVSFTITVNPTPQINGTGNQVVCAGSATAPVNFSGSPAGTTYSWTNSNPAIGLPASGTGNIASFTATNGGNAPITGTISVTTSANSCGGGSTSFTITVNPTATVNAVANQTVCNGSNTAAINFGSNVPGAVFTWTNNNTTIGLIASGVGNIPSFTAYNPTTSPVVATITVTATMTNGGVSCSGPSRSFTITVNPGANIIFTNVPIRVCLTDTVVLLTATPSGGVWAGAGVSANTFNAATAGLGVKTISYTVTSSGCSGTRYVDVTVQDCQERHNVLSGALRLYPNPTTGQFNIRFLTDRYKEFNLNVMDAKGMVVKNYSFTGLVYGSVIPMDLSTLPSGYYILEAYNSQERAAFKLIIAH